MDEAEDETVYAVVVNAEEQYSIWAEGEPPPAGWTAIGVTGARAHCLAHIDRIWTDMRPLSLRVAMGDG